MRDLTFSQAQQIVQGFIGGAGLLVTDRGHLEDGLAPRYEAPASTQTIAAEDTKWWTWSTREHRLRPLGLFIAINEVCGDRGHEDALKAFTPRVLARAEELIKKFGCLLGAGILAS